MSEATDDVEVVASARFVELPGWLTETYRRALALRDRWPQALAVVGPQGIGKGALAMHFARALLCEHPSSTSEPCTTCASCRYVAAGQHPDLRVIEPVDVDEDGNVTSADFIKVDAIRALGAWTQVTSHRRIAKVAVIMPAERMNVAASNALLKTLEEPPASTYLMLVSHQPGRLLPTIASRCQRLVVAAPASVDALSWLSSHRVRAPESALAQAGGAPLVASDLAAEGLQSERSAWLTALANPRSLSPVALAARLEAGGREGRKERLHRAIDWLLAWTADLARVVAGGEATRNADFARALATLAPRVATIDLFRYHREVLEQRALIAHPLQPRLVAESLLIDYRALFV
ncbi:MAG TPA: DNA polymerase III subunit delta' [Casimicrobiaceae bacterium]|nr:DNA polymerase III subunit delta' [Casimicrobiaceae bacterium]